MSNIEIIIASIVLILLLAVLYTILIYKKKGHLSHFGEIIIKDDSLYEASMPFKNEELTMTLSIDNSNIKTENVRAVNNCIDKLSQMDRDNYKYFISNYESKDSAAQIYYDQYHNCLENKLLNGSEKVNIDNFVSHLKLKKVHFYPGQINFVLFDYGLESNITEELLCIYYDINLNPLYISMES